MKAASGNRRLRRALLLIIVGLSAQLVGAFYWSPGAFVLTASLGAPLVVLGVALGGLATAQRGLATSAQRGLATAQAPGHPSHTEEKEKEES